MINLRDIGIKEKDLSYSNLDHVDLSYANLSETNLVGASLVDTDLTGADLSYANLALAYLSNTKLASAKLHCANLAGATLSNIDFDDVDLIDANLSNIIVNNVTNMPFIPYTCPDTGSFIGYKKAFRYIRYSSGNADHGTLSICGYIVVLRIPEDAKRSSAAGRKCRCDRAMVLEIQNIDGTKADVNEVFSAYDSSFVYKVGETVTVDNFWEDRWEECAPGIHFFINREEAVNY